MKISEQHSDDISAKVERIIETELRRKLPDWGRVMKHIRLECGVSRTYAYLILRQYRKNGRRVYPGGLTVMGCLNLIVLATAVWMFVNELTGNKSHRLEPCIIDGICLVAILFIIFLQRRGV